MVRQFVVGMAPVERFAIVWALAAGAHWVYSLVGVFA